jgi:biopolymer transport protein ExbD
MIQVKRRRTSDALEINMGPLIDLVFLLLIFFLVTTTFVKETGLEVHRPSAKTAERKEKSTILIGISKEGTIYMENRIIDIRSVRANVEKLLAENPESGVIVVADKKSQTGVSVNVIDQCRLAGAKGVSIAAKVDD